MSVCCPPESYPYLASDYAFKGTDGTTEQGFPYYTVGDSTSQALIMIPDVWGYHGGRTRALADYYAANGFTVIVASVAYPALEGGVDGEGLPPSFDFTTRGGDFMPWISQVTWDNIQPRIQAIVTLLQNKGISRIAINGFCWGGWVVLKSLIAFPIISTAVIAHPTIHLEEYAYGGNNVTLASSVEAPVLLQPAGGDPDLYREGGAIFEALKANHEATTTTEDYKTMVHGWMPRGDMADPTVEAKIKECLAQTLAFIQKTIA